MATESTRTLDAREVDGEPFGAITAALEDLGAEEHLRLINSFEPEPLYAVLERRGFDYETTQIGENEWRVDIAPA